MVLELGKGETNSLTTVMSLLMIMLLIFSGPQSLLGSSHSSGISSLLATSRALEFQLQLLRLLLIGSLILKELWLCHSSISYLEPLFSLAGLAVWFVFPQLVRSKSALFQLNRRK